MKLPTPNVVVGDLIDMIHRPNIESYNFHWVWGHVKEVKKRWVIVGVYLELYNQRFMDGKIVNDLRLDNSDVKLLVDKEWIGHPIPEYTDTGDGNSHYCASIPSKQ
jgi:hypothetical protein